VLEYKYGSVAVLLFVEPYRSESQRCNTVSSEEQPEAQKEEAPPTTPQTLPPSPQPVAPQEISPPQEPQMNSARFICECALSELHRLLNGQTAFPVSAQPQTPNPLNDNGHSTVWNSSGESTDDSGYDSDQEELGGYCEDDCSECVQLFRVTGFREYDK
jgi:hypothetical protein